MAFSLFKCQQCALCCASQEAYAVPSKRICILTGQNHCSCISMQCGHSWCPKKQLPSILSWRCQCSSPDNGTRTQYDGNQLSRENSALGRWPRMVTKHCMHWFCCTWKKYSYDCGTRLHCMTTVGRRNRKEIFLSFLHDKLACSWKEEVKQKKKKHACLMLIPNALEKLLKSSLALKWNLLSLYWEVCTMYIYICIYIYIYAYMCTIYT